MQSDLNKLAEWSDQWQMPFNVDKCKVMHFGRGNLNHTYSLKGKNLEKITQENDLGILIRNDLKVSNQFRKAYN